MSEKKIFLILLLLFCGGSRHAQAETLDFAEALRFVAAHHPAILAAQAQLRAADEQFAQAQAGWRPSLNAEGDVGWADLKDDAFSSQRTTGVNKGGSLILDQPLYRGGKTTAEMNRARHTILAARANYAQIVQSILLRAGTAYTDLARDRALLALNQQNTTRLQTELTAATERFHGGDVTIGDVNQAQTRAARGQADAIRARNTVIAAQAVYENALGMPSDGLLALPTPLFHLPINSADNITEALRNNAGLIAAREEELAAREEVRSGIGDLLPQVSAFASYDEHYQPQYGVVDHTASSALGLRARLALYDGGIGRAHVRAQKDTAVQRRWDIDDLTNAVRADAARQWQDWQSQTSLIAVAQSEVEAAQAASDAVSAEAKIGTRPVIDVLDADQDLLTAQGALAGARHDEIIANLALAATLGELTPENLGAAPAYDAPVHLRATADKIFSVNPN